MDVVDTISLVRRRKMVVIPVLVVTALLVVYAVAVLPPGYSAEGSILVKDAVAEVSPVSPSLFAESLQDQKARSEIESNGATGTYTVTAADDLLLVRSRGQTASEAVTTTNAVLNSMAGRLKTLETEAKVDPALQSTVNVVNTPETAIPTDLGFEASGSAQIAGANAGATPIDGETLRDALVQVLSSEDVGRAIAEKGGTATYDFGYQKGSPILAISAEGSDEKSTVKTVSLVIAEAAVQAERLADELGDQKASGPLTQNLVVPKTATTDRKGPLRSVAAIGILGLGAALSLAVAVEAYVEWRRRNVLQRFDDQHAPDEFESDLPDAGPPYPHPGPPDDEPDALAPAAGPQGWRQPPPG